jgi:hypothetical protein
MFRDILTPMKSEDQIIARLKESRIKLKNRMLRSKAHARETGANRTTLGQKDRRQLEGEIAAFEWVLGIEPGTHV